MSTFVIGGEEIGNIDARVTEYVGDARHSYEINERAAMSAFSACGCGPGGSCASSCVSGCAERGSCCSYGPK